MIGYENTDFYEDQQQTELEPVAMWIPNFLKAQGLAYLGMALGMFLALSACTAQPVKVAPAPPYAGQRPGVSDFTERFLFDPAPTGSNIVIKRRAPSVEVTPSGYLRDLEAR